MNVKFKRFLLLIILIQLQSYVEFWTLPNYLTLVQLIYCIGGFSNQVQTKKGRLLATFLM